ncbi:MAG: RidA family protein [Bacteroidales bacterium]
MKKAISTPAAPAAIGPYSQAIESNGTIYISGQIPIDPATGNIAETIEEQAEQVFKNIEAILQAVDCTMDNVVKTTVLLADMNHFATVNEIYASHFNAPYPARAAYQVSRLPKDVLIEIESIATR